MSKLCSIIMPTRSAPYKQLRMAITTLMDNCSGQHDDFELLLRLDDDDPERLPVAKQLVGNRGKIIVGPRNGGYVNMGGFVKELVDIADSRWCWLYDDDAWIEGSWYHQLKSLTSDINPNHGVNTQFYSLGPSMYENGEKGGCVGIIIPTELAKSIPHANPVDQQWLNVIMEKGWHLKQMQGCTYHHCGRAR